MHEMEFDLSGAKILVVDDVRANIDVLCQALEAARFQVMVASSGEVALDLAQRFAPELILLDVVMQGLNGFEVCRLLKQGDRTRSIPVIFLTARDDTTDLIEGFAAGGVDYVVKPFQKEEVLVRLRTHLERARLLRALNEKNAELEREIAARQVLTRQRDQLADRISLVDEREAQHWGIDGFIGQSKTLQKIVEEINILQNAEQISVLIQGESGTGKELVARAIHSGSGRAQAPFIAINCATIPHDLADSLLFGHVKGAFTGADKEQAGYFAMAHGGVLFLDEIGALPLEMQPKLLRVLEENSVLPLGAQEERPLDVRVLAATNADLARESQVGGFRQDLYFRLARFTVRVPPLRERREDVALLAQHFLQVFADEMGIERPPLSAEALALLEMYEFPGNVRELKNIVERALIESRGREVRPEHLHLMEESASSADSDESLPMNLQEAELVLIQRALEQSGGNVSRAARLLGIERTKIYRRLGLVRRREASN